MIYKMKKLVIGCLLMGFAFTNLLIGQASLAEGIKLFNNENYTEAQNFFESIIKKEPSNALPHYYLGQIKYALEDYKGAKDDYAAGYKISTKCNECAIGLAKLNLDNGNVVEATKTLDALEKSNKKSAPILALIGDAYLYSKKPNAKKALEVLTKSRDLDPKIASTWAHMGDAAKTSGDLGTAMSSYETAVSKDPTNLEAYMSMAKIWASSRQQDLAIEKLESALKLSPDYAPAYKSLYELYMNANQFKKMLPVLDKYVSLAGSDVKAKIRLVKFLCYTAKDYDRTITEANTLLNDKTINLEGNQILTLNRFLAWAYGETQKYQESYDASKILFQLAEQDTSRKLYVSDYDYLAQASLKLGKIDEAQSAYEKVFEQDSSKKEEIYGNFAKKFYEDKNYENAIVYYLKKNAIKPLGSSESFNLANAYYATKKYNESDAVFSKIVEATPNYSTGWLMKARIAKALDPTFTLLTAQPSYIKYAENAENDLLKATEDKTKERIKKNLIEAYDYLGTCAAQKSDNEGAKAYFEKVVAIDPANANATNNLKILSGGK